MQKKERAQHIIEALETEYPDAKCSLESKTPLQLLIATRLSAQCTDARVNMVTPALFERYPTAEAFAQANPEDIGKLIYSCGFYITKAKDIVNMCRMLICDFGGKVPDSIEELIKLPGVGRKTANLIVGDIYGKPSIVVDTHCIRITNLLGLSSSKDPVKVEEQLRKLLPPDKSGMFCHRLVWHGRAVCIARRPLCAKCCLAPWCNSAGMITATSASQRSSTKKLDKKA